MDRKRDAYLSAVAAARGAAGTKRKTPDRRCEEALFAATRQSVATTVL